MMRIGLTFDEYVDLKLKPQAGADQAFQEAARMEVERMFPMTPVAACAKLKIESLSASYLFLRPAIRAALLRAISDKRMTARILAPYEDGADLPVQGSRSCGRALPAAIRQEGFERLRTRCATHGITLHVCGCKNPDLTNSRCHLVRPEPVSRTSIPSLFPA